MKIVVMHMYEERGISHEPFQVVFCLVSYAGKHLEPPLLPIAPGCPRMSWRQSPQLQIGFILQLLPFVDERRCVSATSLKQKKAVA